MDTENGLFSRFIDYLAQHFWRMVFLSLILVFAIPLGLKFLSFLPHPVVANAKTVHEIVTHRYYSYSRYGGRSETTVTAPIIEFDYDDKRYQIVGGSGAQKGIGIVTKVIFERDHPTDACEYTFLGLVEYDRLLNLLVLCVFMPSILYGIASIHGYFSIDIKYHLTNLTAYSATMIAILLILLPLMPHCRQLIYGEETSGIITEEITMTGNSMHRTVNYEADGKPYKIAAGGKYDDAEYMIGMHVPVLFVPENPQNAFIHDYSLMYLNNWCVVSGIGLVFLVGWFLSSRADGEDTTLI